MLIGPPLYTSYDYRFKLNPSDLKLSHFYTIDAGGKIAKAPLGDIEAQLQALGLDKEKAIPLSSLSAACLIHGVAKSMGIIPGLMIDGDEALMRELESRVVDIDKKAFVKEMIDHWNHCLTFPITHAYADLYNPIGAIRKDGSPFVYFGAFELFIHQYEFGLARILLSQKDLFVIEQAGRQYQIEDYIAGKRKESCESPKVVMNFENIGRCNSVRQALMILSLALSARHCVGLQLLSYDNLSRILASGSDILGGFDWIFQGLQEELNHWLEDVDAGVGKHMAQYAQGDLAYILDDSSDEDEGTSDSAHSIKEWKGKIGSGLFTLLYQQKLDSDHPLYEYFPVLNSSYWASETGVETGILPGTERGIAPIDKVMHWASSEDAKRPDVAQFQYIIRREVINWCERYDVPLKPNVTTPFEGYTSALVNETLAGEYLRQCQTMKVELNLRPHQLFALAKFAKNAELRDLAWTELQYRQHQQGLSRTAHSTVDLIHRIQMLSLAPIAGDSLLPIHLRSTLTRPREPIYPGWSRGGVFHRYNGMYRKANILELSRVLAGESKEVEKRESKVESGGLLSMFRREGATTESASAKIEAAAYLTKKKGWGFW